MNDFDLEISTLNAAFADGNGFREIARLLRQAADKIESEGQTGWTGYIRDINGNRVGEFTISHGAFNHG
jgi:hypothetical protein